MFNHTSAKIAEDLHLPTTATNSFFKALSGTAETAAPTSPPMTSPPAWGNAATLTPTAPGLSRVTGGEYGDTNQVFCSGYAVLPGGYAEVFLSDGSTAYSDAGEIQWIKKHSVKVFGKEFRIKTQYQVYSPQPTTSYSSPVTPAVQPQASWSEAF